MNILNIEHISKTYGDKAILEDVSCGIEEGDKIGIIGINGTGKTTLLKMIAGLESPDEGQIITRNGLKLAYLPQNPELPANSTVLSYVLEGTAQTDWEAQSRAQTALNQLGMTSYEEIINHLSGGQKKKVALAKILTMDFDMLLLDEPTNHLDNEMLSWLEEYLSRFKGVVIMVTHDRYFLDKVTNRILEISRGNLYSYVANYSQFLEMKAQREERELASERKRQSVLRMEMEWAKRGCRARTTKQKARLDRLEILKNGMTPISDQTIALESVETRMGKKTIELHHARKCYGDKVLIDDFDYIILRNQRLGIVGFNGCGKSTLLKVIAGLEELDSGSVELGETIKIGYFAQEVPDMDTDCRVIDYIKNIAEYVQTKEGRITASQMLERFLFIPDMQYAPVEKLSGGEKKRLYLLAILMGGPNVLLLDEANNDLDIPTLTILEDYLNSFSGIVVTVSHDRYFLDNVVDRIFEFSEGGHLQQFEGGYTEYMEAKQRREGVSGQGVRVSCKEQRDASQTNENQIGKKDWKRSGPVKPKFSYKEQREFEVIDGEIAELEAVLEEIDEQIEENATNSAKLGKLMQEKTQAEKNLEQKVERWVYLNDLHEQIIGS